MRGELLAERFRIGERLGSGSMGEVWAAQDERMRRDVAVKLVQAVFETREAETQARFRREVQLAGRLSHQNIVTVHDWGEVSVGGRPVLYLVMELVRGVPLGRKLSAGVPSWPIAVGWTAQIARALAAAHRQGVVHRDIKPANVLLTPEGTAKVLDFGVAKFIGETMTLHDLTATGTLLGSPAYMSPEQAEGVRQIDHRSDLYSLGCLLYHAVTGRPPFVSDNSMAVLRMQMDDPPVPPGALAEGLPAVLDRLILNLLAKSPADRPADAAAVHDTLSTILVESAVAGGGSAVLEAARLGHADPVAGILLGKVWELRQRAGAEAQEAARLRDAARVAETEAVRVKERAEAEARGLLERAEEEARRVRAEARSEAERLQRDAAGNAARNGAASQRLGELLGQAERIGQIRQEMVPVPDQVQAQMPAQMQDDAPASADPPFDVHPRFTLVRNGYDRAAVDEAVENLVSGLMSLRANVVQLEQAVVGSLPALYMLEDSGRTREVAQRMAEDLLASMVRQAEQEQAGRTGPASLQGAAGQPATFPLARRGYDRGQVDAFLRDIEAENHRMQMRLGGLERTMKVMAAQTRSQRARFDEIEAQRNQGA